MTKSTNRKFFLLITGLLFISSCTDDKKEDQEKRATDFELKYDKSKVKSYLKVLDNLNQYGYVPYFRQFKRADFDFEAWNLNSDESVYLSDSVFYETSQKAFFNQEREFLNWLVSFKSDTLVDKNRYQHPLWNQFVSPYSSTLSPCSLKSSKSRQALSLIYGFLDGESIACVTCKSYTADCLDTKWSFVEWFLKENSTTDLKKLRRWWKTNSDRQIE